MELEVYKTINEVKELFDVEVITCKEDLLKKIKELSSNNPERFFRGVNDASYKMYASSQRYYINDFSKYEKYTYMNYLKDINECSTDIHSNYFKNLYDKQSGVGKNSFVKGQQKFKIEYNSLWQWVFLQHLCVASPLIDFSSKFEVALFFAWYNANYISDNILNGDTINLQDYIQIIHYEQPKINGFANYKNFLIDIANKMVCADTEEKTNTIFSDNSNLIDNSFKELYYIPYGTKIQDIFPLSNNNYYINFDFSNPNIVAQQGFLLINNNNGNKPLEHFWIEEKMSNHPYQKLPSLHKVLIHKSLLHFIQTYLEETYKTKDLKKHFTPLEQNLKDEIFEAIKQKRNFK